MYNVRHLLGIDIPPWLGELFDQLGYSALMSVIYLAIIGTAWTVCRQRFGQLLEIGEVDVISAIAERAGGTEASEPKQHDSDPANERASGHE